jgi:hypothetical protein
MTTPGTFYDHFNAGYASGRPGEPSSLTADAERWNQPHPYAADSVLGQTTLDARNGRSEDAAQRVLPFPSSGPVDATQLPSQGVSPETNEAQLKLRQAGSLPW